ncbi:MAG TPA: calcium-binding protein [Rhizomicrobium sp.]|jgi:Ca2+-binding RTX toxin-like protein|nr:calcium-binding protein [Rhizomicrobium sp.]
MSSEIIEGIAVDPTGMDASGSVTITFGDALSGSPVDPRSDFLNLLSTTTPVIPAVFGGVTDSSANVSDYVYNSAPFGNCGQLNALGGAYFSAVYGYQYEMLYSSFGHVICTIDFPGVPGSTPGTWIVQPGFQVVETYGSQGLNHFMNPAQPDSDPFFTLAQIQAALPPPTGTGNDPDGIWTDVNQTIQDYYGASGATITPSGVISTNDQWNAASVTLASNESVVFGVAPYDESMLYGLGQMTPLASQSFAQNASPVSNEVTVQRVEGVSSPAIEHIEDGFPITGVGLRPQPGFSLPANTVYAIQSWYAANVWPVAPKGTIALPGFTPDISQTEWIASWQLLAGASLDTGSGVIITGTNGTPAQLQWSGSYTNTTGSVQTIWLPIVYRTDTPTSLAGGSPVATLTADGQTFNFSPTDLNLHYQDLLVTVNPGQSLNLALQVTAGDDVDIVALGTETNISDIISPQSPADAVDVDFSGISYQANLDLDYSVQVNPGQNPTLQSNESINNLIAPIYERNPLQLNQATVTRTELPSSPSIEHIQSPFYLTGVTFQGKPGVSLPSNYLQQVAAAAQIFPVAPTGDTALPGFTPDVAQSNVLSQWQVVSTGGSNTNTASGLEIDGSSSSYTYLMWTGTSSGYYTNNTSSAQFLWIPLVYRTDTPSPVGDVGQPVASMFVQQVVQKNGVTSFITANSFAIYPADRDVHYKDMVVQVDPGETVRPYMEVFPGEDIDVMALGTEANIADILSPENPAESVDVDLAGLPAAGLANYRSNVDLSYSLLVSPYLSDAVLTAGSGTVTLSSPDSGGATLVGGPGTDTFVVHDPADVVVENYTGTNSSIHSGISYALPANVDTLVLTGTANLAGTGNSDADWIYSNSGVDTLIGGGGNDVFSVSNSQDVVTETPGTAAMIYSSVSYTLPNNVNELVLQGSANLTGKANSAGDWLYSNSGIDTLIGGGGNDVFAVYNSKDVVNELPGTQAIVYSTVSYTVPANVVELVLQGTSSLVAVGNGATNVIYANNAGDTLMDGGGASTLIGGSGNDKFYVTNPNDHIIEQPNGGVDTIISSVKFSIPTNVETLQLTGSATLTATGNSVANNLYSSLTGVDTLIGGGGNDVFLVYNSNDVVNEVAGTKAIVYSTVSYTVPANIAELVLQGSSSLIGVGNGGTDVIYANNAGDTLMDGGGASTLIGGSGNDAFYVTNPNDHITEQPNGGVDTVISSVSFSIPTNVETLQLTGNAMLTATGNSAANNLYSSLTGVDTLVGGGGNDAFLVYNSNDVVQQVAGTNSIIYSTVNYALPTTVNNLFLSGSGSITASGNTGNDVIYANSGNDTINAGTGNDTIFAGSGKDSILGGSGKDTFAFMSPTDFASITDFLPGTDSMELSSSAFGMHSLQSFMNFIAGTNPTAAAAVPTLLYNTSTGDLSLAPQGTGSSTIDTFANLATRPSLQASNFTFT